MRFEDQKKFKERFKVYKNVFEQSTINSLWKLITEGKIEGLESPIKIGKESNVFSALTRNNERVAVKIYRIGACDFNRMYSYLNMDERFKTRKTRTEIVLTWARREFKNLTNAYESGVSVPKPIALRGNVMVMEFIGEKNPGKYPAAAPLLKNSCDKPKELFGKLLKEIILLSNKAKLAHGDLSEFNILNLNGNPCIIDLSHAIPTAAPVSKELLERDILNICSFFNRFGLKIKPEDIYEKINENKIS